MDNFLAYFSTLFDQENASYSLKQYFGSILCQLTNFVCLLQENAWSLTARIRSRGDAGPDPEYQVVSTDQIFSLCDHTFKVGLDLTCSSSRGLNFEDFPFFTSSIGLLEAELAQFKDLKEIGDI